MGYTTDELVAATRERYGEDTASSSRVSDAQILKYLNSRQRELCAKSDVLLQCAKVETQAGQETYNLPNDYLKASAVFIYRANGLQARLDPIELHRRNPVQKQSLNQFCFFISGENLSGSNVPVIGLNDIPSVTSATKDLEIFYREAPNLMVAGGSGATGPEVPHHLQDALIDGALASIYWRLSTSDSTWLGHFDRALSVWNSWIKEASVLVNPLILDQMVSRRDSAYLTYEWDNE